MFIDVLVAKVFPGKRILGENGTNASLTLPIFERFHFLLWQNHILLLLIDHSQPTNDEWPLWTLIPDVIISASVNVT